MQPRLAFWCPLCAWLATIAVAAEPAPKPKVAAAADTRRLDAKLAAVSESFLRDTAALIVSYENVGQFDRAKLILEVLQKLDPKNEAIRAKLKELNERIIAATQQEVDLEADAAWTPVGRVVKGRPIRIEAAGAYKLVVTVEAGPDGAATANLQTDLVAGVPLGALMGVILPPPDAGDASSEAPRPQPRPFAVGAAYDRPADRDGILYLKVNVPAGARCTGGLKARVFGADRPE